MLARRRFLATSLTAVLLLAGTTACGSDEAGGSQVGSTTSSIDDDGNESRDLTDSHPGNPPGVPNS